MRPIIIVFCFATVAAAPRTVFAEYDAVAATCVPDGTNPPTLYLTTEGTVMNKPPTQTGLISLYCPLTKPITAPRHLDLLYFSTENDPSTFVRASYFKMSKSTGAIGLIAIANSHNGVNDDQSAHIVTASFSDSYDTSAYVYFVRIDLRRRNIDQVAIAYRVTLR